MRSSFLVFSIILTACGGGGSGATGNGSTGTPTAMAVGDVVTTAEETSIDIRVTDNDVGVTIGSATLLTSPQNGTASIANDIISYLPDDDFFGTDSLTYNVSVTGGQTLSATVNINVTNINDAPIVQSDSATTLVNTPININVKSNDTDVDGDLAQANIEILSASVLGQTEILDGLVRFIPSDNVTGNETITYRLRDTTGAFSNTASLSIQVIPISETTLTVTELGFPTTGYTSVFNAEFADTIDQSAIQSFEIPPNALSFALYLEGNGVTESPNDFIVSELISPGGVSFAPLFANVEFCDIQLCSLLIPRAPEQSVETGTWQYRVASLDRNLNFPTVLPGVKLSVRTGPTPQFQNALVSEISIKPIVTANSVAAADIDAILAKASATFALNGISVSFDPVVQLNDPQFAEVSANFLHVTTRSLVSQGDASKVNIFLLESFAGVDGDGLLGISGSIPSPMGFSSIFNAVLINGTATRDGDRDFHISSTAAVLVHEIGHYLGLAHSTEDRFQAHDYINDTPQCLEATHDINLDGVANQGECPDGSNIMFWMDEFVFEKTLFSADQQRVMHFAPIGVLE